jgi:NTP pyrophosphatase (non-canonical NTP hydrolase)
MTGLGDPFSLSDWIADHPAVPEPTTDPYPLHSLDARLSRYLQLRQHTCSSRTTMEAARYLQGEVQELIDALEEFERNPTRETFAHVKHEHGDVLLSATNFARFLPWTGEEAIEAKTQCDIGRG